MTRREQYERDGYLLLNDSILPADLAARAGEGLEAVRDGKYDTGREPEDSPWKPGSDPRQLVKIEMPQLSSQILREVLRHPNLGKLALELTGAKWVQVWWVQGLIKPSAEPGKQDGTKVGWHQDKQYWHHWTDDSELFTAWLALSDVTLDAGPMRFVPGSHKWGLMEAGNFYGQELEKLKSGIKLPPGAAWTEVPAVMPAGGVSFHHQLTFHGSGGNTSGRLRRSLAIHLRTDRSQTREANPWVARYVNNPDICPTFHA
jgi:hypothetical protein